MIVLGINSNHANASVCFVENGKILYAIEEERLNRIKNSAGFPEKAIKSGLDYLDLKLEDIKHVAVNTDPLAAFFEKFKFTIRNISSINEKISKLSRSLNKINIKRELYKLNHRKKFKLHFVEHHISHISSAFYVSGFQNSLGISIDGSGDFTTTAIGICEGNQIKTIKRIYYPHSLGIFYTSLTKYLGFNNYGDEYKVMGLSSFGSDSLVPKISNLFKYKNDGEFNLNLEYFNHHRKMDFINIVNNEVKINNILNENKLENLIGIKPRKNNEKINDSHKDLAFAAQFLYEKIFFNILNFYQKKTKLENLCLAGGCANNSSANGKILQNTNFKNVFIQPASTDAGGALGAALFVDKNINKNFKKLPMKNIYLGNSYSQKDVDILINSEQDLLNRNKVQVYENLSTENIIEKAVQQITNKKIIAIFRDRIEWGSRSLGNRSIVGDPRIENMKEILNLKIKLREDFRPFAPSILCHCVDEWFEIENQKNYPFMMEVKKIKNVKKKLIPAVTHIDGTGRLQTVSENENIFFFKLINKFFMKTGVPILLNTSFNENEPIVLTPQQAISTFLRTKIDGLILQNTFLLKNS